MFGSSFDKEILIIIREIVHLAYIGRVPVSVSHVAIGESSKELAKPNLWILAILAKSINISFS